MTDSNDRLDGDKTPRESIQDQLDLSAARWAETLAIFADMEKKWQEAEQRRAERQEADQSFEQMMAASAANHEAFLQKTQEMLAEIARLSQQVKA